MPKVAGSSPVIPVYNMKLIPKNTKYRKQQKGYLPQGTSSVGVAVSYGQFGVKALESGKITANQIESCRRLVMRQSKKVSKLFIRVFPDIPVTKKPVEVRMGKGKGAVDHWICKVQEGKILFELDNIDYNKAKLIFNSIQYKLPIKTRLVFKQLDI